MVKTIEEMMDLSDEEFLAMNSNGELGEHSSPETNVEDSNGEEEDASSVVPPGSGGVVSEANQEDLQSEQKTEEESTDSTAVPDGQESTEEEQSEGVQSEEDAPVAEEPDYKALYEKITAPFKANGKEFKVQSPEEVIRLMQQGAGAGKKMAQLAPNLRILKTLEQHGLMDEAQLSFLIDIKNKNPEAIKKLIKDSNIDPLDINVEEPSQYVPVNHTVPQEIVNFGETLSYVAENFKTGRETISLINETWDPESKKEILDDPSVLKTIAEQRENGVFDQVTSQIERMQILGDITPGTPFIRAYAIAGAALVQELQHQQGQQPQSTQQQPAAQGQQQVTPRVLDQRAAAPRSKVSNQDKVVAAGVTTRSKPTKTRQSVEDIFSLNDEEFMRQFHGRI